MNNVIIYSQSREPAICFAINEEQTCGVDVSIDINISWFHVQLRGWISYKRVDCIKSILTDINNLRRKTATISFSGFSLLIDVSPTGTLSWKCEIKRDNMNACFFFCSDVTFLPELLSQIDNCTVDQVEHAISDSSFNFKMRILSVHADCAEANLMIHSEDFDIDSHLSVTTQEWHDFCVGSEYLFRYLSPLSFSPLGNFMTIKMWNDNDTINIDCDISDFCFPSNHFYFHRRINHSEYNVIGNQQFALTGYAF